MKSLIGIIGLIIFVITVSSTIWLQMGNAEEEPVILHATEESRTAAVSPPEAEDKGIELSYQLFTLLPRDAIPAIDDPSFYDASRADAEYAPDELVLGVTINGKSKAYSSSFLDSFEIVNDNLGGKAIAVTW